MVWIGLTEPPDGALQVTAHAGASADTLRTVAAVIGGAHGGCEITAQAMRTGQAAICNDIAADSRARSWRDAALERHYRAMAALPLRSGARVVGTFNLYAGEAHVFDDEELSLLDELAADISFALEVHEREANRRRITVALEESEERFRQLSENIQEAFLISEPQSGRFVHVSPAYETIWGRPAPSPFDVSAWLETVHPEDRARWRPRSHQAGPAATSTRPTGSSVPTVRSAGFITALFPAYPRRGVPDRRHGRRRDRATGNSKNNSGSRRRWMRSASWRGASRTTSTTS